MWLVVGASSGVGRATAERLARRGDSLLLVARDVRDLDALAADLRLRHHVDVNTVAADGDDPAALAGTVSSALPEQVDGVVFALGEVSDDDTLGVSTELAARLLRVNLLSCMAVVDAVLPAMVRQQGGSIVAFSSVAALRGRSTNVAYAAAKRALESYLESLRHGESQHGIEVHTWVLGYVATQMAYGRRLVVPAATPEAVADRVVRHLGGAGRVRFEPRFWRLIGLAVRAAPASLFRRVKV